MYILSRSVPCCVCKSSIVPPVSLVGEVHPFRYYLVLQVFQTKTPDEDFETLPRLTSQRNPSNHRCDAKENPMLPVLIFSKSRLYFHGYFHLTQSWCPSLQNLDLSVPRLSHKHMKASRTKNTDVNPIMFNPDSKNHSKYILNYVLLLGDVHQKVTVLTFQSYIIYIYNIIMMYIHSEYYA